MFIALAAPPEQEDYFIGLSHTERAWVAVDELVPLLKALTTAIPPKTSEPETHAKYAYTNIVPAHYAW